MKIGVISDLHFDRDTKRTFDDYVKVLSAEVSRRDVTLLLVAGDMSNDYELSYRFIVALKHQLNMDVLFVPGNHDYWQSEDELNTLAVHDYFKQLPECLIERPYIINDQWAVVGHSGWYNYSYADTRFAEAKLAAGKFKGSTWQDKLYIDWKAPDKIVSRAFAETVRRDIEQMGDRHIILMTHMVTDKKFTVPLPHRIFDFYNAYIGTSDFDDIYNKYAVKYSIMGHVHFRKTLVERGITYICACLGYTRQWRSDDLQQEVANALYVIEI
ncbi:metallophosphoesterase [Macrococcus equipercicus]|uniref:Metallophosphoesterase n=1 Tax=Macrococcus equipercicus TaxID=69967 RepID=A0A9Q9BTV0_9STAP|nr:metallophosphoesterase [Macrococcus equipercicus]UTH13911.1 metallophosphoesterase [Macrococcus equipercicus]